MTIASIVLKLLILLAAARAGSCTTAGAILDNKGLESKGVWFRVAFYWVAALGMSAVEVFW